MTRKTLKLFLILILSTGIATFSSAQTQTGSVSGNITDNEGTPLPGASVTLSGPNLMGTLSYLTTQEGDFRFPSVPPGRSYTITVELSGFKKVIRGELIVSVGKTTRLVIALEPTTLSEEITVTAPSPTVDVTRTKQAITYSADLLTNIPIARTYQELIATAPGTVSTGLVGYTPAYYVHGSGYRTNLVSVDGAIISDRALGSPGLQLPFDIFEEVELEIGAHPAEVGMTEGAYVNIVSKSGGNEFHGSVLGYYFNRDMARSLIPTSEVKAAGLTAPQGLKQYYDYSGTLGGPILKDKLWFFFNGRISGSKNTNETSLDGIYDMPQDNLWGFSKLTFQLTHNIKLTAMGSLRVYDQPLESVSYYANKLSSRYTNNGKDYVGTGIVNWVLDQNTFMDLKFGGQGIYFPRYFEPDAVRPPTDQPSIITDRYTGITNGLCRWEDELNRYQLQGSVSFNHFMDDFLGGDHELKAGVEYEKAWVDNPIWTPYAIQTLWTWKGLPWGYHDAVPYMGYFRSMVVGDTRDHWNLRVYMSRYSAYIQDSFNIKNRLTLNFGLRYNTSEGYNKAQKLAPIGRLNPVIQMLAPKVFAEVDFPAVDNIIKWSNFEPRVGIAYDLFGDNKTSLKASWSRYNMFMVMEYYISATPMSPHRPFTAYWYDLDKDGIIETTDDYKVDTKPPDIVGFNFSDWVDPNLKGPYTDEILVGIEREAFKDFSAGVSFIYKKLNQAFEDVEKFRGYKPDSGWWVPYTVTEPGADGKFGTGDEQQITVYGVKKGAPVSTKILVNPEGVKKSYKGIEFLFTKRMSHGWQLLGSLTLGKSEGNIESGSVTGFSGAFDNPNYIINRFGRIASEDRPVIAKLQGSINLPLGFMVSSYLAHYSGTPFARSLQIQLPNDPNTYEYPGTFVDTVNAESPGARRYKASTNMDARLEKSFNVADFGRFGVFVDVLNLMGDSGYNITQDPGGRVYNNGTFAKYTNYGRFTGAYGLRTYKVSARFTF